MSVAYIQPCFEEKRFALNEPPGHGAWDIPARFDRGREEE